MQNKEIIVGGKRCCIFTQEAPEVLLIEPMDNRDLDFLEREIEEITAGTSRNFALASLIIEDWNSELTPWAADPVFGKEAFGNGAPQTLRTIEEALIPSIEAMYPSLCGAPRVIGGYSLSALFALWCAYQSDSFAAIAAASPSVWYPNWLEFTRRHTPKANKIYLSLGESEHRSRSRIMATVRDCIVEYFSILSSIPGLETTLEWNPGNHFTDTDKRTARAFLWAINKL